MPPGLGGAEPSGDDDARLTDPGQAGGDELGAHRGPVDLLEDASGVLGSGGADALQGLRGILVAGPQTLQVEHADAAESADEDRRVGAHHRVHGRRHDGQIDVVGVELPAHADVADVPSPASGDERDVVEGVGATRPLGTPDLDL